MSFITFSSSPDSASASTPSPPEPIIKSTADPSSTRPGYICGLCGNEFVTIHDHNRHWEGVHSGLPKKYACSYPGCTHRTRQHSNLKIHMYRHLSPEEKDKVTVYCPEEGCTRTWIDPAAGCRHLKNAHGYKPHHRPDFVSRAHPKSSVPSSSKPKPKTKSAGVKKRTTKKEVQSPTIKKEELTPKQMQTQTHMQTFQDENQEAMDAATWTAQACRELAQFLLSCSQSEPSTPSASSPASPSYSSLSASALTPESSLYSTPKHSPSGSSPSSASPPLRTPSPWENLVLTYPDDEELYIANQRELTLHEPVPQYPQQQQYQYQDASVAQCGELDADSILEFFSSVIEYQRCLPSLDASMNADTAMTFDIDMDGTTDPALFNAGYDASSPEVIGLY